MDSQPRRPDSELPPMDLPRRQPGKKRSDFFGLCDWTDLTRLAQLFAYYARYVEGSGDLTAAEFCEALPPLISGPAPLKMDDEITEAVQVGIGRGIFKEIESGAVTLTYSGDLDASDIPFNAEDFIWNSPWPVEWAAQMGAKTGTDRLVAYHWYLEQCRRPSEEGDFEEAFLDSEPDAIKADAPTILQGACRAGWLVRTSRASGIYHLTDLGRERVLSGFPSLLAQEGVQARMIGKIAAS